MLHRLKLVVLLAFLVTSSVFAADAVAVAAPVVTQGLDWSVVAGHVIQIVIAIFAPFAAIFATLALKKLATKLHVDASFVQDQQVAWAVSKGVTAAKAWADAQAAKPSHNDAVDVGFKTVDQLLENPMIQTYGIEPLKGMISAELKKLDAPAPAAPTTTTAA